MSEGLMHFLRDALHVSCSISGSSRILCAMTGYAAHIKQEAEGMGAALSQAMCDQYYSKFKTKVDQVSVPSLTLS